MAEIVLAKQKIEKGKTERLREWMEEITEREAEAVETLKSEGMHSETAFIEQTEESDFLIYYMKADSIEQVYESFEDSSHDIDQEHKQVMSDVLESGENVGDYELLYHLENPESS
jgi:PHP family Zn ribbon phosphoesterase